MFDVFWEFNFINLLSFSAFLTTVGLFFCGIPICRQIWKRQDTNEISGAPFLMGVLGGYYGWLKHDQTVMSVTTAQCILYSVYCVYYFFMSRKKFWISIKIVALIAICASLILSVHFFGMKVFHPLGIVCLTLNIGDFAAPLAGLKVVIRRRATSTLPLPLCIANFMVSTEWFLYGLLVKDFYLIFPNGIGSFLAFSQLILFVVLPRKPNQMAPYLRLYYFIRYCGSKPEKDIEQAAVVPVEKNESRISKHRWSTRVIANVTGEIENVINKVHLGDQFAYSSKLNEVDDTITLDSNGTPTEGKTSVVYPLMITNEEQLLALSRQLMNKLDVKNVDETITTVVDATPLPIAPPLPPRDQESKIQRWKSAPDLCKE
ncbi:Sugar transporter SWEET1 [Aphelenchoides besseyi]|nr:Sugar transporter SWEET1 [Aphelenchoides besseyi]